MKVGEANARLKQLEVALDAAQSGKQNAETEAALTKEKAEASKSEAKRIELMVSVRLGVLWHMKGSQLTSGQCYENYEEYQWLTDCGDGVMPLCTYHI